MRATPDNDGAAGLTNEATQLIQRYPALSSGELDRLVAIYPRLAVVDVALMLSDDRLGPPLEAFRRKERRRLWPPLRDMLGLLSPVFLMLIIIGWTLFH